MSDLHRWSCDGLSCTEATNGYDRAWIQVEISRQPDMHFCSEACLRSGLAKRFGLREPDDCSSSHRGGYREPAARLGQK